MEFKFLKDKVGEFAAKEMIDIDNENDKFSNACKTGNIQILDKMFTTKKITQGDALVESCKHGNLKLFKILLSKNTNFSNEEFQNCLYNAVENDYPELVKYILNTINFEFDYSTLNYKSFRILNTIESIKADKVNYKKCFIDSCLSEDIAFFNYCFDKVIEKRYIEDCIEEAAKCACLGNTKFAIYVLSKLMNYNNQDTMYNACLLSACEVGNIKLVELILKYKPTNIDACINEIKYNLCDENYVLIYNLLQYIRDNGYNSDDSSEDFSDSDEDLGYNLGDDLVDDLDNYSNYYD